MASDDDDDESPFIVREDAPLLSPAADPSKDKQCSASGSAAPFPKQVFFIFASELCERFSYYGW
jgi:hypothetical protein